MNIKELLLEGCSIEMPYKRDRESWVSDVNICIISGCCAESKIHVSTIDEFREFKLDEIDDANPSAIEPTIVNPFVPFKESVAITLAS